MVACISTVGVMGHATAAAPARAAITHLSPQRHERVEVDTHANAVRHAAHLQRSMACMACERVRTGAFMCWCAT
jgi:hypothetical protein